MDFKNLYNNIEYLEFINNLDFLINKLLYSDENGYINKKSKEAIIEYQKILEEYNYESSKFQEKISIENSNKIIKEKKLSLIYEMEKHREKEIINYADEVFEDYIDNCLFKVSINKNKSEENYSNIINAINWITKIKKLSKSEYFAIIKTYSEKFNNVLKMKENDFIPKSKINTSDINTFLEVWDLISQNQSSFLNYDFEKLKNKLTNEDINYLENIKNKLKSYKKTDTEDEIDLICASIDLINTNDKQQKYNFIKDINCDFTYFLSQNGRISEKDKIDILKSRIKKYTDCKNNQYYKKLLNS